MPRVVPDDEERLERVGVGSGVIISEDGYIITNNHVIDNADHLSITLNNNKSYDAEVIGTDPNTDLALYVFLTVYQRFKLTVKNCYLVHCFIIRAILSLNFCSNNYFLSGLILSVFLS